MMGSIKKTQAWCQNAPWSKKMIKESRSTTKNRERERRENAQKTEKMIKEIRGKIIMIKMIRENRSTARNRDQREEKRWPQRTWVN